MYVSIGCLHWLENAKAYCHPEGWAPPLQQQSRVQSQLCREEQQSHSEQFAPISSCLQRTTIKKPACSS